MTSVVKTADLKIMNHAKEDSSTQGMGTTIVLLWIVNNIAHLCWCGDSRAYVFNKATGLCRISKDHSYVQQLIDDGQLDEENAMDHPLSNVITRCLGDCNNRAEPDFRTYAIKDNDCFLLCSDGLHGRCSDEVIINVMNDEEGDVPILRDKLIQAALAEGGDDNITIVLCKIEKNPEAEGSQIEEDLSATIPPNIKCKTGLWWKVLLSIVVIAGLSALCYYLYLIKVI